MHNLPPQRLAGAARYISGQAKPLYMMEGLDASFDAVLFVSYHASAAVVRRTVATPIIPRPFHRYGSVAWWRGSRV